MSIDDSGAAPAAPPPDEAAPALLAPTPDGAGPADRAPALPAPPADGAAPADDATAAQPADGGEPGGAAGEDDQEAAQPDIEEHRAEGLGELLAASGMGEAGKRDEPAPAHTIAVAAEVVQKVRGVFVPPLSYVEQRDAIGPDRRLWAVTGEAQSGRFTCAVALGLALRGQGPPADPALYGDHEGGFAQRDTRTDYEPGLALLRRRLEAPAGPGEDQFERDEDYAEFLSLEAQLEDALRPTYESENVRAERHRVLGLLSRLAYKLFGASFWTLCSHPAGFADTGDPPLPLFRLIPSAALTSRALLDILRDEGPSPGSVYICESAFESGVRREDLVDGLRDMLRATDSYLILTAGPRGQALRSAGLPVISTHFWRDKVRHSRFLQAILESHLDYYESLDERAAQLREQVDQLRERLLGALRRPKAIDQFCAELRWLPAGARAEEIAALADQLGHLSPGAAREWFQGLGDNERLYAMLVALFEGVDRLRLDDLYAAAVSHLRQGGVGQLCDPRAIGLAELRNRARVQIAATGGLQFNHDALAREARAQIASYHPALWSVCEQVLVPLVLQAPGPAAPSRESLGVAVGRVGMYHWRRLDPVLDSLADHDDGAVAATVGHILDGVARADPASAPRVAEKIASWARSRAPYRMWAASASIWRVYGGIAAAAADPQARHAVDALAKLRASLSEIAARPHSFDKPTVEQAERRVAALAAEAEARADGAQVEEERDRLLTAELQRLEAEQIEAITYALAQIARHSVADVVALVRAWLEDPPDSKQHWVGTIAALRLMEVPDGVGPPALSVERHELLLDLVAPMLDADERAIRVLLGTLRRWALADGWATRIGDRLHRLLARAPGQQRRLLAELLCELWTYAEPAAVTIAHRVAGRSRLIDGWPVDVAGDSAVILVDQARPTGRQRAFGVRLAHTVAGHLAAVTPVAVRALGLAGRHDFEPGELVAAPRLGLPALEAAGGPGGGLALILAWGPVLDLEDLGHGRWAGRALLTALGPELPCPPGVTPVPLPARRTSGQAAEQIVDAGLARLAQGMAARDAAAWWRTVAPALGLARPDAPAILARLKAWVAELDRPPASPDADPLRAIIATVCWLSAANLNVCVTLLVALLHGADERERLAGGAAARALLRLYGSAEAPPPPATHAGLLRLLAPLAPQGLPGVEAALFAARRWARDPAWADRLLDPPGGGPPELLQMIDALGAADRVALGPLLERWGEPLSGEAAGPMPAPAALVREALALQLGRGPAAALPPLAPGQGYGLLVLASSARRRAAVAREAARAIMLRHGGATVPVILRLGRSAPLGCLVAGDDPDALALDPQGDPAPLLGPLLERARPEQVRFVVLIGEAAPLDEADWEATTWAGRLYVYRDGPAERGARQIPPGRTAAEGGEAIAAYLAPRAAWG